MKQFLIDHQEIKFLVIDNINQDPDKPLLVDADVIEINFKPCRRLSSDYRYDHREWILGQRWSLHADEEQALRLFGKACRVDVERARLAMNMKQDLYIQIYKRMEGLK